MFEDELQQDISVSRFTVQQAPEGLIYGSGQEPSTSYSDKSGTATDQHTLNTHYSRQGFMPYCSEAITEKAELVFRNVAGAAFFQDSAAVQSYIYTLLGHTAASGLVEKDQYGLTAEALLRPFLVALQLPNSQNKHFRPMLDTCYGEHYIDYLQSHPSLHRDLKQRHSSILLQTSSTSTKARGVTFTPAWEAIQHDAVREHLLTAFSINQNFKVPPVTTQMPALYVLGECTLGQQGSSWVVQDPITKAWFFNSPRFFHYAVMVLSATRQGWMQAERVWHASTWHEVISDISNLTVLSCKTKMDKSQQKFAVCPVLLPSTGRVVSVHLHLDDNNQVQAMNLREAQPKFHSAPHPHLRVGVSEELKDPPNQPIKNKMKGMDMALQLSKQLADKCTSFGANKIDCWKNPSWDKEVKSIVYKGDKVMARGPDASADSSVPIESSDMMNMQVRIA